MIVVHRDFDQSKINYLNDVVNFEIHRIFSPDVLNKELTFNKIALALGVNNTPKLFRSNTI